MFKQYEIDVTTALCPTSYFPTIFVYTKTLFQQSETITFLSYCFMVTHFCVDILSMKHAMVFAFSSYSTLIGHVSSIRTLSPISNVNTIMEFLGVSQTLQYSKILSNSPSIQKFQTTHLVVGNYKVEFEFNLGICACHGSN